MPSVRNIIGLVEVPPNYKEVGEWKAAQPNEENLRGDWWEIFNDPQLNTLEQQVNISNQNLKAAEAQYTQARALVRYNRADYFPTVAAGASASRARVSERTPRLSRKMMTSTLQRKVILSPHNG